MTATPSGITYKDYLALDDLLSAQRPLSTCTMKCCSSSSTRPRSCGSSRCCTSFGSRSTWSAQDKFAAAYKAMARVSRIQSVMTLSWDVLATLTPVDYSAFREVLGTSSGFQSAQFREVEYRLGIKDERFLTHYAADSAEHAQLLARAGSAQPARGGAFGAASAPASTSATIDAAVERAWLQVYRDSERWFDLYQLAEKLVDLDDAMASWRHKHVLTVERIIGNKQGTGGSAGAAYLRSTLEKRAFPELWSLRTEL